MSKSNVIDVLIVGDSRMKLLEPDLNNTSLNFNFTVKSLPGAQLHHITLKALTSLSYSNSYRLVIISGGINDMTRLVRNPTKHALPRHSNAEALQEVVLSEMRKSVHKIKKISDIPLVMATLPGMDLVSYSPDYADLLTSLQPHIDVAITEINKQVRGINRLNNIHTLNLAYPIHRCKGNGGYYRNQYTLLSDGLHPSRFLRDRWVDAITKYCSRIFPEAPTPLGWNYPTN